MSLGKKIVFALLPLVLLVFIAESAARLKLYFQHGKNAYYLKAPLGREAYLNSRQDHSPAEGVVEYQLKIDHFFDEASKAKEAGQQWDEWSRGANWYYKHKPGTFVAPRPYSYGVYAINSLGFRGKELVSPKKASTVRIFCLGESSTFGLESPDEETWPARLERYLNGGSGNKKRFEVVNAAFGGFSSLNMLNLIRYELINYQPDVFLLYAGINDLNIERNYKKSANRLLVRLHELLYYRLSMAYTLLVEKGGVLLQKNPIPITVYSSTAKESFLSNVARIVELSKKQGIQVVVIRQLINVKPVLMLEDTLTMSAFRTIERSGQHDEFGVPLADYLPAYRHAELMTALQDLSSKHDVAFFDFRKQFLESRQAGIQPFFDYVHLTPRGNKVLARLVAGALLEGTLDD